MLERKASTSKYGPIILASIEMITAMDLEFIEHIKSQRHGQFFETQSSVMQVKSETRSAQGWSGVG